MAKEQKTLLNFPSQIMDWDKPMSDEQLARQTKIVLTRMLNRAVKGEYVLTEKDKTDIAYYNEMVLRWGYAPIDCDLAQF